MIVNITMKTQDVLGTLSITEIQSLMEKIDPEFYVSSKVTRMIDFKKMWFHPDNNVKVFQEQHGPDLSITHHKKIEIKLNVPSQNVFQTVSKCMEDFIFYCQYGRLVDNIFWGTNETPVVEDYELMFAKKEIPSDYKERFPWARI